jgi:intracellular multiplication protein IcmK
MDRHIFRSAFVGALWLAGIGGASAQTPPPLVVPAPQQSVAPAAPAAAPPQQPAVSPSGAARPPTPDEAAFNAAIRSIMPMTSDQIRDFRRHIDQSQRAVTAPVGPPPKPVSRSVDLSLRPGEAVPTMRLAIGHVGTLTFSDISGKPWPVLSVTTGNAQAFVVQSAGKQGESNIIVVNPLMAHGASNLVVTLVNSPVPVIFTLQSGQAEVDFRMDVRLQQRGPNSTYDIVSASMLPPTGDSHMIAFLDGVPPSGSRRVKTSHRDVEAWMFNDMLYVRTRFELLSPAYVAKSSNVSGFNVFSLSESPSIVISESGRMQSVQITGR